MMKSTPLMIGLLVATAAHATVIFSNFTEYPYDRGSVQPTYNYEVAQRFTASSTATLTSLELALNFSQGVSDLSTGIVNIYSESGGLPADLLETIGYSGQWIHDPGAVREIFSALHPVLTAGQDYFVSVTATHNPTVWHYANIPGASPIFGLNEEWIAQRPPSRQGLALQVNGTPYIASPGLALIGGSAVPEPSTTATALIGAVLIGSRWLFKRRPVTGA